MHAHALEPLARHDERADGAAAARVRDASLLQDDATLLRTLRGALAAKRAVAGWPEGVQRLQAAIAGGKRGVPALPEMAGRARAPPQAAARACLPEGRAPPAASGRLTSSSGCAGSDVQAAASLDDAGLLAARRDLAATSPRPPPHPHPLSQRRSRPRPPSVSA